MIKSRRIWNQSIFANSVAILALTASVAAAREQSFDIIVPITSLSSALQSVAKQTGANILFLSSAVSGVRTKGLHGHMTAREAVALLIRGANLKIVSDGTGGLILQDSPLSPKENTPGLVSRSNPHAGSDFVEITPALLDGDVMDARSEHQEYKLVEAVEVSASRITTAGFNAPTPTTVIGSDFIEQQAKDNIFDAVKELPFLMGSTGQQVGNNSTSGGSNGLSSFNVFGLGTIRTLTLLDGQRVVPANVTGVPDISEFPQLLIQRVDVVTGGASASWGSDAMGGVVNFVTDKNFNGFKANISSGLTTYGDDATATIQVAAGSAFAGGKGHFEVAGEFMHADGVGMTPTLGCCTNTLPNGRNWFVSPIIMQYSSPAATPAGVPQYYNKTMVVDNQIARYGLINSGPLQGIAFGPGGTPYQWAYGTGPTGIQGVVSKGGNASTAGAVTNCLGQFCVGGELASIDSAGVNLAFPLTRGNVYSRLSYDVTPNLTVFATVNWAQVGTTNIPNPAAFKLSLPGVATNTVGQQTQAAGIQCGNAAGGANAFLPASINAACIANNITSFGFGSMFDTLGPQVVHTQRDQRRFVAGADGAFSVFGTDWTFSSYYEHGENDTNVHVANIPLNPYFYAAIDSVQVSAANQATYPNTPAGAIVCRNPLANAEGCVPFNPFGNVPATQAQTNWIYGGNKWGPGPIQISHQMQDAASFSVNGTPFSDWAGKVSIASGIEYRQEAYDVRGDGAGNGNINGGRNCSDLLLDCVNGTNWYAASFHNGNGNYHVTEGFVEAGVPLLDSTAWGRADLDIAGRYEKYSTSGTISTWKVGLTWDTPIDGLRLRALQSRDVRAPNLSELFAAPTTANSFYADPWIGGTSVQTIGATYGNTALKPEKSINTQIGFVVQPSWFPGFSTSVDYYRIYISGQISTVPQTTSIANCYAGLTQYCSAIITGTGTTYSQANPVWLQVNQTFFNVASTVTDGFNIESSYQFSLNDWDFLPIPGNFTIRALATHVSKFITNPGLPGTFPIETAGTNDGAVPHWKVFGTQTYSADNWQLTLSETWISQGVHNRSYVQCAAGSCPVPTLQNPTIDDNHVPGEWYLNVGGSYNLNDHWKVYAQIDNVTNKNPPIDPAVNAINPVSAGANGMLYDIIGRMYHLGVRISD